MQLSAATWAVLGTVGAAGTLSGCGGQAVATANGFRYLRPDDVQLFSALIPGVLSPLKVESVPDSLVLQVVQRVDAFAANLEPTAKKTIYQLFDLLNMRVTRWAATGISSPWSDANEIEIEQFLLKSRASSFELFNVGYRVLTKLITAAYFSSGASQEITKYPGRPSWAKKTVEGV